MSTDEQDTQKWIPCTTPEIGDTIRWNEPIWAEPNKPRGKRDQIGEQNITATLITTGDLLELTVIDVKKILQQDTPVKIKTGDIIRRKSSSLEKGKCYKKI